MANNDTIYIDIDDEITSIIDKLRSSNGKVVALVLPKRASVFQSVVNMKLLKRAADTEKKTPILITSEAGLLPLAGLAGLHVAKTLTSKPEIPLAPSAISEAADAIGEDGQEIENLPDSHQSIGELADKTHKAPKPPSEGVETLMLNDDNLPPEAEGGKLPSSKGTGAAGAAKVAKKAKDKKLKIPNFSRFRLLFVIGVLILILFIAAFIFASVALTKATINIKTNATNVDVNLNLTASTRQTSLDMISNVLPAKAVQTQKTYSATEVTTGQTNNGAKAQGNITVTETSNGPCAGSTIPNSIPSGTGFTSNGLTYITEDTITFVQQGFGNPHQCTFQGLNSNGGTNIPITAQAAGSASNTSGTPFTDPQDPSVNATGSASGGTDDIVQTVNQNDINNAKNKININSNAEQQLLSNELKGDGYYPLTATYSSGTPVVTSSASVGSVTNTVTVTETVNYIMFGVHKSDLTTLIDNSVDGQINTAKQSILSTGLNRANYNLINSSSSSVQLAMSTVAIAGPQLNTNAIKQQSEGLKAGQVQSQLQNNPNVTGVTVHFSPFWVSTVPKNTAHITVVIAKPTKTAKSSSQ